MKATALTAIAVAQMYRQPHARRLTSCAETRSARPARFRSRGCASVCTVTTAISHATISAIQWWCASRSLPTRFEIVGHGMCASSGSETAASTSGHGDEGRDEAPEPVALDLVRVVDVWTDDL